MTPVYKHFPSHVHSQTRKSLLFKELYFNNSFVLDKITMLNTVQFGDCAFCREIQCGNPICKQTTME